jgi:Tfp pilus assembly protein PilX
MSAHLPLVMRRPPRGVSLIIAMLMLVIIGIMSVAVMRSVTSTDQVATGNRVQTQANQAAQMALRFCEDQLSQSIKKITVSAPASPAAWTVKANWTGVGVTPKAYTLRSTDVQGGGANFPPVAPQCLAEVSTEDPKVFTVTARGFSPDYRHDNNFATTTGSVIWLQSTVYLPDLP